MGVEPFKWANSARARKRVLTGIAAQAADGANTHDMCMHFIFPFHAFS
jgi:hypothetical protein